MTWKVTVTTITIIIICGIVKAHMHFIRLALLAILGLLGMYLLHKLAQDWNKIRGGGGGGGGGNRPRLTSLLGIAGRLMRISKRSVDTHVVPQSSDEVFEFMLPKFSDILHYDPLKCAQKFACILSSKLPMNMSKEESSTLEILRKRLLLRNA